MVLAGDMNTSVGPSSDLEDHLGGQEGLGDYRSDNEYKLLRQWSLSRWYEPQLHKVLFLIGTVIDSNHPTSHQQLVECQCMRMSFLMVSLVGI